MSVFEFLGLREFQLCTFRDLKFWNFEVAGLKGFRALGIAAL